MLKSPYVNEMIWMQFLFGEFYAAKFRRMRQHFSEVPKKL
jgi:hypothetical protein